MANNPMKNPRKVTPEIMEYVNKRDSEHTGYDFPIRVDIPAILKRFEDNHNRKEYFKNDDKAYWDLVKRAIVVSIRMAECYREQAFFQERYRFDSVNVNGGGGSGDIYHIGVSHNLAFWWLSYGTVYINFKERKINIWLEKWRDEGKNHYHYRKEYTKPIPCPNRELKAYHEKYFYKDK